MNKLNMYRFVFRTWETMTAAKTLANAVRILKYQMDIEHLVDVVIYENGYVVARW